GHAPRPSRPGDPEAARGRGARGSGGGGLAGTVGLTDLHGRNLPPFMLEAWLMPGSFCRPPAPSPTLADRLLNLLGKFRDDSWHGHRIAASDAYRLSSRS